MTIYQKVLVFGLLLSVAAPHGNELHHGDCLGADDDADMLAVEVYWKRVVHPPLTPTIRAFCKGEIILEPKNYLARNRDIVDATTDLIATPKDLVEPTNPRGSGTWYTIRYALQAGKRVHIVFPDGRVRVR